ncbi:MAG: type II secretion system F family protein [Acidobacteria bacterium]|nr:type II secretion system F family protein [Acidobacteriota bacterium]MCA1649650.1 type II secretion system F family protein [Acidobacteriota bacterium]
MGTAILLVLAFVFGVALVVSLFMGGSKLPGMLLRRKLDARLMEVTQPVEATPDAGKVLVKVRHEGLVPGLDRALGETARGSAIGRWIEQSGVKTSISSMLLIATVVAVPVALLVGAATRAPWGLPLGAAIGFSLPFIVLKVKRGRRLRAFEEQFPEGLDLISRALKAGHAFATGLKMVADELPEPVGPEFRKTFDEQNFGLPLKDALENLTYRIPILDVRFFATAVLIQRETGGNLSEILENLAHVVRERFKILRQVRVYTAHGRLTGYVLLALPAVLGIALSFINPEHMNMLFRERIGQMLLMTALVMQTIGFFWIKQVVKIEV